jgi:hypothetical protein
VDDPELNVRMLGSVQVPEAQETSKSVEAGRERGVEEGVEEQGASSRDTSPKKNSLLRWLPQLDPENNKTLIERQKDALYTKLDSKAKANAVMVPSAPDDTHGNEDEDFGMNDGESETPIPMAPPTSITQLREKLHARIASLKQGGPREPTGGRDELLEERRRQRAALRAKRRKEKKERMRKEKEKGVKEKPKEKDKGHQVKVKVKFRKIFLFLFLFFLRITNKKLIKVGSTPCARHAFQAASRLIRH